MKFILTIDLGNDAMQTNADIADALRTAAFKIQNNYEETEGSIFDENGNRVGSWSIAE